MCVIFAAYKQHRKYPLILLANRDEFYDRPTASAAHWEDDLRIYAGRDQVAGGTWIGISTEGRFAAVTNYRDPRAAPGERSRGALVADHLSSEGSTESYLEGVAANASRYSGFNLLAGRMTKKVNELFYFSNRGDGIKKLGSGIYGLSNHLLNTAWPKVSNGLAHFSDLVKQDEIRLDECFDLLDDKTLAADEELPDTGIGIDKERLLSPIFIRTPVYGTRSSTVVLYSNEAGLTLDERVFV